MRDTVYAPRFLSWGLAAGVTESLMVDAEGRPTSTLLKGTRYGKDNRILPAGWVSNGPDAASTAPVGTDGDPDFVGGADTVTYDVTAPAAQGPYQVQVSLLYTPLSARWYADLVEYDTPEVRAFVRYYETADRRPETIAAATATVR